MAELEITATTIRNGITVDEVHFDIAGYGTAEAYLVHDGRHGEIRPVAVAVHGETGDRSSLLPDLKALAAKGVMGLAIDSQMARDAIADRDHLAAFDALAVTGAAAIHAVTSRDDAADGHLALLGRGLGGEVAAHLAARTAACRVVIAAGSLLNRAAFLGDSAHGIAAGFRLHVDDEAAAAQVEGLAPKSLIASMTAGTDALWQLQIADDDGRFDDEADRQLAFDIPSAVRITHHDTWADLGRAAARQERVDLIRRLT